LVVVEHLVVVATHTGMSLHEYGVWPVDHDLPDVIVGEKRFERAVAGDVAECPLGDKLWAGDVEGPNAPFEVLGPSSDFSADGALWPRAASCGGQVGGVVLGLLLPGVLDLLGGREPGLVRGVERAHPVAHRRSADVPSEPGSMRAGVVSV